MSLAFPEIEQDTDDVTAHPEAIHAMWVVSPSASPMSSRIAGITRIGSVMAAAVDMPRNFHSMSMSSEVSKQKERSYEYCKLSSPGYFLCDFRVVFHSCFMRIIEFDRFADI